jgi:hypothetical protein
MASAWQLHTLQSLVNGQQESGTPTHFAHCWNGWAENARDQRLATLDFPSGPILSRVRCIASFGLAR